MKVAAQALFNLPVVMPLAGPRFLANSKVRQSDIGHGSIAAILAVFLLRKTVSGWLVVAVDTLVARRGAHVVPDAPNYCAVEQKEQTSQSVPVNQIKVAQVKVKLTNSTRRRDRDAKFGSSKE